tara:strand:- start:26093 stop:27163 length:1071 start_codon:yes stop_codon:yes gene_type:complete
MDTGVKISGIAHGVLIGIAAFGMPLFSADNDNTIRISEVSLITSDEFAAMSSGNTAPAAKPAEIQPTPTETTPTEPTPEPEVDTPVGEVETDPIAPIAQTENVGELQPLTDEPASPKAAKTISNAVVEAPTDPVKPTLAPKPAVIEAPSKVDPPQPTPKPEVAAAQESTTKIVTEADKPDSKLAPARSARPQGRPKNLKLAEKPKPAIKPETKTAESDPVAEPAVDPIAAAIAADLAAAVAEAANQPADVAGPPMTGSETAGLVFAIQQCWNVPVGLENDASNIITMGVKLTREGRLAEEPRKLAPQGGSAAGILQAYESARRALIRCQPYDLPIEKYETWKEIEIVFNPQQMVLR